MSTWFITGISRGFGRTMTEELLRRGHTVIGTTRNGKGPFEHNNLRVFRMDVNDPSEVTAIMQAAVQAAGRIDVVVNNAGYGLVGAVEEVSDAEVDHVMATNFGGTHRVIKAALPFLRAQGSGHIVNFSSVGGFAGSAGFGIYCASKFAVEGMSEALAIELKPLGINVTIVEPGYFRTEFLSRDSAVVAAAHISAYADTAGLTRSNVSVVDGRQAGDPVKGVAVIIDAVESGKPPFRLPLGADSIARIEQKMAQVQADIAAWRDRTTATAFDD
ncbi:SDR family NAD(P)-dependent oxidoreductase [Rhodanobacter sp. 7MK24]|uniref:SDR family NAD(P)-dependent oxidoreductase n=1 Tax=Rhodanobacter sp. 7MK24 TaxID=2775922 RepID=UPI00177FD969|nr:SDR family NAD(P)-dependent oxidoreductase [Rhodanobacter sp. 7MK24]MBD8880823.1 SDR family NAD(P)-dependent oxidoreductase [Rhodanobacter sp. 7MK24]